MLASETNTQARTDCAGPCKDRHKLAQGTLLFLPIQIAMDQNDAPVAGAKMNFYLAGTTTPATVYSDVSLTTPTTQPLVADGYGRFAAYYVAPGVSYKIALTTSAGVALDGYPQDNVPAIPVGSANVDVTGTAGATLTAGEVVYLSDGSGSKSAGQWYAADSGFAYASTIPLIGMTVAAITSAQQGSIRIQGQITGIGPLIAGTDYYVGAAGALTQTAPTLARKVGRADSTSSIILGDNPSVPAIAWVNQFRLSLTTGVPVTTADVTGSSAVTIFAVPYQGNIIDLPDATGAPQRVSSAQFSIAVPATTSQMYDVYAYLNGAVATLELLAWTNDTTRATALVATGGRLLKTGDLTRMYLGSMRTGIVSGQTEDSVAKRFLWNYYNRLPRPVRVLESTASWAYTVATIRQVRAQTSNQIAMILGVAEVPIDLTATATISNGADDTTNMSMATGIGEDSTTAFATGMTGGGGGVGLGSGSVAVNGSLTARLWKYPAVGYHFYAWLEWSQANGTTTWWGAPAGYNGPSGSANGLTGSIDG